MESTFVLRQLMPGRTGLCSSRRTEALQESPNGASDVALRVGRTAVDGASLAATSRTLHRPRGDRHRRHSSIGSWNRNSLRPPSPSGSPRPPPLRSVSCMVHGLAEIERRSGVTESAALGDGGQPPGAARLPVPCDPPRASASFYRLSAASSSRSVVADQATTSELRRRSCPADNGVDRDRIRRNLQSFRPKEVHGFARVAEVVHPSSESLPLIEVGPPRIDEVGGRGRA